MGQFFKLTHYPRMIYAEAEKDSFRHGRRPVSITAGVHIHPNQMAIR